MTVRDVPGAQLSVLLPVSLTAAARRKVTLATGRAAKAYLDFHVAQLTELDEDERRLALECLDLTEVIVGEDVDEDDEGRPFMGEFAEAIRYGEMTRNAGRWYVPSADGRQRLHIDEVCYPGPNGRTLTPVDLACEQLGEEFVLGAMRGRPAVDEVDNQGRVSLASVLDAYAKAVQLATLLSGLTAAGHRPPAADDPPDFEPHAVLMDDQALILCGTFGTRALHRGTSEDPFALAVGAVQQVLAGPQEDARQLADGLTRDTGWRPQTDEMLAKSISMYTIGIVAQRAALNAEAHAQTVYESDRAAWIQEHGSTRLRRAAARGYRIDGLYRDERIAHDLPGAIGFLGKSAKIREVSNPTSDALDQEQESIEAASQLGLSDEQVRIVYVVGSEDLDDGEYVQISDYLARHTVYVKVESSIPF